MSPELIKLLADARAKVDAMTPEEREEMFRVQRESMAKAYREGPSETRVVVLDQIPPIVAFAPPAGPQPDYRMILLNLAKSLTLSDNRGDAMEDVWRALKLAGVTPPDYIDEDSELADWLESEFGAVGVWR